MTLDTQMTLALLQELLMAGKVVYTLKTPYRDGTTQLAFEPVDFIARLATEKPMARTAAGSRSGMDKYELHGHLSEQLFRAVGGYVANFSSSVSRISQEIYSQ